MMDEEAYKIWLEAYSKLEERVFPHRPDDCECDCRDCLVRDCDAYRKENLRLRERIEKLIEAILWASPCGQNWITPEQHPSYETIGKVMREAIVQDQEAAK